MKDINAAISIIHAEKEKWTKVDSGMQRISNRLEALEHSIKEISWTRATNLVYLERSIQANMLDVDKVPEGNGTHHREDEVITQGQVIPEETLDCHPRQLTHLSPQSMSMLLKYDTMTLDNKCTYSQSRITNIVPEVSPPHMVSDKEKSQERRNTRHAEGNDDADTLGLKPARVLKEKNSRSMSATAEKTRKPLKRSRKHGSSRNKTPSQETVHQIQNENVCQRKQAKPPPSQPSAGRPINKKAKVDGDPGSGPSKNDICDEINMENHRISRRLARRIRRHQEHLQRRLMERQPVNGSSWPGEFERQSST